MSKTNVIRAGTYVPNYIDSIQCFMNKEYSTMPMHYYISKTHARNFTNSTVSRVTYYPDCISNLITEAGLNFFQRNWCEDSKQLKFDVTIGTEQTINIWTYTREGTEKMVQLLSYCPTDSEVRSLYWNRTEFYDSPRLEVKVKLDSLNELVKDDILACFKEPNVREKLIDVITSKFESKYKHSYPGFMGIAYSDKEIFVWVPYTKTQFDMIDLLTDHKDV